MAESLARVAEETKKSTELLKTQRALISRVFEDVQSVIRRALYMVLGVSLGVTVIAAGVVAWSERRRTNKRLDALGAQLNEVKKVLGEQLETMKDARDAMGTMRDVPPRSGDRTKIIGTRYRISRLLARLVELASSPLRVGRRVRATRRRFRMIIGSL